MTTTTSKTPKTLSSGIIPLRKMGGEWQFLLLRCYKYWDFPKGQVEEDEDPWAAAVREFQEETGITKLRHPWGKAFRETEVYSKGKVARYYLGEVTPDAEVKFLPNPETGILEHHEYRWLSYAEARKLLVPRVQKILDWSLRKIEAT